MSLCSEELKAVFRAVEAAAASGGVDEAGQETVFCVAGALVKRSAA